MTPQEIMREFGLFVVEGDKSPPMPCETCNASRRATHTARVLISDPEGREYETLHVCCECNNCDADCEERESESEARAAAGWDSPNGGDGEI